MRQRIFPLLFSMMVSCLLCACEKEAVRQNALRELFPTDFSKLSAHSQQMARDYGLAWIKSSSVLGTSGLHEFEEVAFKELQPLIEPLKNGSDAEKAAFAAGLKIHEVLHYVGVCLGSKKPFNNPEFNSLLRYSAGDQVDKKKLADGIKELIFDYIQIVDKSFFRDFWNANKTAEVAPSPHKTP